MYAYVSMISTDNFMPGVLVLYESLKKTGSKYPFYLMITSAVTKHCEAKITDFGISVIRDDENILNDLMQYDSNHRWNFTFDKIKIFKLEQFKKIVFLDSDMYVNGNLDSLFGYPNFSAVKNRDEQPLLGNKKYFNSGLMVIEPSMDEYRKIINLIDNVYCLYNKQNINCGDQNVFNHYKIEWPEQQELHLPDKYNVFWSSIDKYLRFMNYDLTESNDKQLIYVIHFTGEHKPWQKQTLFLIKTIFRPIRHLRKLPKVETIQFLLSYFKMLKRIKIKSLILRKTFLS